MPATSLPQQRLFQAVAHGATFPLAEKLRREMTPTQIEDFTVRAPASPGAIARKALLKGLGVARA